MTALTPAKQPAIYAGTALAVASLAAVIFLHPTQAQVEAVVAAAPVLAGVLARFFVMPAGKPLGDIITLRAGQATQAIATAQAELDSIAKLAAAFAPAPAVVVAPAVPTPVVTSDMVAAVQGLTSYAPEVPPSSVAP